MSDVLVANISQEYVRRLEPNALFSAVLHKVHIHFTVQNHEDLRTIIYVPLIRLICPV